jgi:hypothetical protein
MNKAIGDLIIDGKRVGDHDVWNGPLNIYDFDIVSLEGCPKTINGDFVLNMGTENPYTKIKSLVGGPEQVLGNFSCSGIVLDSLVGGPKFVYKSFIASRCKLKSLEGAPEVVRDGMFSVPHNELTSIEHAPREIGKGFSIFKNNIKSFRNVHHYIEKISCLKKDLQRLRFDVSNCVVIDSSIKDGLLSFMMIEGDFGVINRTEEKSTIAVGDHKRREDNSEMLSLLNGFLKKRTKFINECREKSEIDSLVFECQDAMLEHEFFEASKF